MKTLIALTGGLAGACILTAIHQLVKNNDAYHAPRMDLLGMESLTKLGKKVNIDMPADEQLYKITMAADIVSNALYYSAAGIGDGNTIGKGALLGLAAGIGAVVVPGPVGLNPMPSNRTPQTKLLAVAYYFTGGLVAAGVMKLFSKKKRVPQLSIV